MAEVICESRITHVQVYARGAVVTRRAPLPATLASDAAIDVVVPNVSPLADAGSLRAHAEGGGREVTALRTRLVIPATPSGPGPLLERVRELDLEARRLEAERAHLQWRRDQLAGLGVVMGLSGRDRRVDPARRVTDALAVNAIVGDTVSELEARLVELAKLITTNAREREAAAAAAAQGTSADRAGAGHPTRELVVRLSPGTATALEVAYVIGAARWWPAYTARLADGATRATWALDAFVAQVSGEDWTGVALSLSTADLVQDARLPELPSLRLGRAQPAARKGYRPPPPGLDEMFAGYNAFVGSLSNAQRLAPPATVETRQAVGARRDEVLDDLMEESLMEAPQAESTGSFAAIPPPGAPPPMQAPAPGGGPMRRPAMMASLAAPAPAPIPRAGAAMKKGTAVGAAAPPAEDARTTFGLAVEAAPLEPTDAWLDFDALRVEAVDPSRRGRLVRAPEPAMPGARSPQAARASIEQLAAPAQTRDPLRERGQFDFRYDAQSAADVPSNARVHRVEVRRAEATSKPRFRTVPREAAEIYREVSLENPFGAPLLAGPVDVFLDGGLLTTSTIGAVDTGGTILLGLGVEERVRIARNARVEEGTAGLLGGSATVDHEVTMELRSSLGRAIAVEVIDRVPVTSDDELEISFDGSPPPEKYTQVERGAPVRGGLRWLVELPAGGKTSVVLRYRLKLSGKHEVVGGNRRE